MHLISNSIKRYDYNNNQPHNVYSVECQKMSYKLFLKFIRKHGFKTWHIHNGWVSATMNRYNYVNNDILHDPNITITWIGGHTPTRCPNIQDFMVIVKNVPDIDRSVCFTMYCYDVVGKNNNYSEEVKLKLIEKKKVIFNHNKMRFEYYKHINIFKKIKNYIKWIT